MSYDPSQAQGTRAVQIDINSSTVLSDDIVTHTDSSILARNKYFIECKVYYTSVDGSSGYLAWENWANFAFMGGLHRSNSQAGAGTAVDDYYAGANVPNTTLSRTIQAAGGSITSRSSFRPFWRIE